MPKFMQTLDNEIYEKLATIAKERGITIQELIRAVIIPEWLKKYEEISWKCPYCGKWIPLLEREKHLSECKPAFKLEF